MSKTVDEIDKRRQWDGMGDEAFRWGLLEFKMLEDAFWLVCRQCAGWLHVAASEEAAIRPGRQMAQPGAPVKLLKSFHPAA